MMSEQEARQVDIEIKTDPEYKLPKVIVLTDRVTDEVNAIVNEFRLTTKKNVFQRVIPYHTAKISSDAFLEL